ncbi:ABC transporter ATP-binding protein [Denitrobaculum tricleocarpae]|uniref:ABC transporter ATP-binding protein n=1 Tax=Denitrobaculum tricleocarpae TaxID=2591009 RepID=A0A545TUI0_9PROT|nr:ATP-binding cassette domain-containing protein [Denitrobaculum tricleocarpae]TQV80874.1 ABC transporter ATP-binding protein [Denitrobaculum tricleocarpae]
MPAGSQPLLQVEDLVREYRLPRESLFAPPSRFRAVNGVSFSVEQGKSFGIVGESGCGKSTLARTVMGLEQPVSGRVLLEGRDISRLPARELRSLRRKFQMVFQDPYGSLDPRLKVERIVAEPLEVLLPNVSRSERRARVEETLNSVGLKPSDADRYPHEFSGGQRQRVAIARALITEPSLIVADEPVSALDVSVQAQVLNLIMDLQTRRGLTFLFISHDLSVVRHITDEVAVMYEGEILETGPTHRVFSDPQHSYTKSLISAVPYPDPRRSRRLRRAARPAGAR